MKKAVAYCRVSTAGQVGDDKYGIDWQRAKIEEYAEKHDIKITDWFIDEGVSGAEKKRPALDKLLGGEVSNPPVEYILVAKADRLARDISLYYAFKYSLQQIGLEIVSAVEDWSAQDKITGTILETFLALVGEIEKENIRVRTSGGRTQKAKQGGYAGGQPPFGYRVSNGQLVINQQEADVVRFIFRNEKKHSVLGLANLLNECEYKSRSGKPFQHSTVRSILENKKTYQGYYRYGKEGKWVQGQHEPIL